MVATKATQKSTAMDYLASPRSEGLVVGIMTLLGYTAPKGGRLLLESNTTHLSHFVTLWKQTKKLSQ